MPATPSLPEPDAERRSARSVKVGLPDRQSIVIGRGADCDVAVADSKASRHHCRVTRDGVDYILEDLDSKNGTFVNGERISGSMRLRAKATFQVGDTMLYLAGG